MSDRPTLPPPDAGKRAADRARWTRITAASVLVPAVPLLLLSVLALASFYASPARFDRLLTQLPGQELIRSLLIFAPATLLGIVILAVLYALERPPSAAPTQPTPAARSTTSGEVRRLAPGLLLPAVLLLLVTVALRIFAFVAPGRWAALLAPLPGDRFLAPLIRESPWVLLVLTAALGLYAWRSSRPQEGVESGGAARRVARLGATATLVAAVPMLGLALTALGLFAAAPERFDALDGATQCGDLHSPRPGVHAGGLVEFGDAGVAGAVLQPVFTSNRPAGRFRTPPVFVPADPGRVGADRRIGTQRHDWPGPRRCGRLPGLALRGPGWGLCGGPDEIQPDGANRYTLPLWSSR